MSGIRATIDDIEVPVVELDFPRFSFNVNDLENPDKITGSRSTTFRMPATREVRRVLGGPGMTEALTSKRPRLRIGNGGQVLYESKVVPVSRNREEYSVVSVGDNAEWFELAKNTKLRDLDMGTSPTITDTLMRDSWDDLDTSLYFPLIDFGSFEDRSSVYNVTVNKIRPAIRPYQFLREAFAQWGFSLSIMGSLGSLWKRFVIPNTFGNIAIGESFLNNSGLRMQSNANQTETVENVGNELVFGLVISDPSGTYTGTGRYQAPFDETGGVLFRYDLWSSIGPLPLNYITVYFDLYDFTAGNSMANFSVQLSLSQPTLTGTHLFGENFTFVNGNEYGVRMLIFAPGTSSHIVKVLSGSFVTVTVLDIEYQEGVTVDVAGQAPNMTVMQLLKAIASNRCLITRTNAAHGEVQIWLDSEFYRGSDTGIDWRTRINHNTPATKELPLYPVRIEYRWKEDDNDRDLIQLAETQAEPGYGNYDAELEDGTNDPMEVEMPFAPTAMAYTFDEFCFIPVSRKEEGTYQEDDYDREPRLLIADGLAEGAWRFDGVDETQYPRCYFINSEARYTLAFGSGAVYGDQKLGTAQLQWSERQRRMTLPVLRADVMIHPDEIWNIDQGVPRLVNDGTDDVWMYAQEINQFTFASPEYTECVLIPM